MAGELEGYGWMGHMVACSDDGGGDGEGSRARTHRRVRSGRTMRHVKDGAVPTRTELSVLCGGLIVRMDRNSFMFFLFSGGCLGR